MFSKEILTGESVKDRLHELKRKIEAVDVADLSREQLICLPASGNNLFEIIPIRELRLSVYREYDLKILGLAGDKAEAIDIVEKLVSRMYTENKKNTELFIV